ncbi:telomere binding protein [Mortierella sp. AM989]|nr:telomere binding protein [Mortierella sp. AM989]
MRISSLSRPFDHLTQITSSISSVQPSAKSALNGVVHRLERAFSFLSSREDTDDSGQLQINSHNSSATVQLGATSSTVFRNSGVSSGRFNPAQDGTLLRRRTLSLSAHTSNPSSASISRPWALTRTIQAANFWRRDEKLGPLDSSFDDSENDESGDDFDSSIHLALPFQLLLVSQRFADATVQSLWRNLVFHGHDAYQMQSLLSTLSMDDGISYDPLGHESGRRMSNLARLKVHEEEVVEDDDKVQENDDKVQENDDKVLVTSKNHHAVEIMKTGPAAEVSSDFNTYPPKYGSSEHQPPIWQANETNMSWIDSLKNPSKFQGAGVYGSNTEALATAATSAAASTTTAIAESSKPPALKASHAKGQRRHTSASSNLMYRNGYQSMGSARNDRSRVDRNGLPGTKPNEPRWSYRRHVRRAVLNFSHPQASPQMFLKVLECLRTRCPDQIVALDLHANEKMRDAGLDKPEELERYFGSGFSKLRYLRLQGGFVDNQLLCALIKGLGSSELASSDDNSRLSSIGSPRTSPMNSTYFASSCKLSQVFLGPGSITDTAVEKLIAAAGHCLEVFTVTSCVDVGGGALADLLTSCPKLRVLGVHRSLARDKDLLEGLGIEVDGVTTGMPQAQMNEQPVPEYSGISSNGNGNYQNMPPARVRKTIVAPLERLELGTVKLTGVGVTEILKGTCESLRFLVLETQHFSEELLTDVITPFCSKLEGLYFDDPEYIQKQQQQMQGLGFSAGRRGTHLPNRQFEFGRSKRTFYSDPSRHHQRVSLQPNSQHQQHNQFPGSEAVERQNTTRSKSFSKVSAWLGETTTEEWIACGDCALWISSASPGVSYENGGPDTGSQRRNSQHPRWQPTPLYNAYHSDTFMRSLGGSASGTGRYSSNSNGEYDDILAKFQVRRATVENVIQTLKPNLTAFTVMQSDFIEESQGVSELKMLMQQDERWSLLKLSMADSQDSEAISAYLTDLQNQVSASSSSPSSPTLSAAIRVLSEPLSFLGLLSINATENAGQESIPQWAGPVGPTTSRQLYFIQHFLPSHLDFILDNITLDWLSALPSAQQSSLFDAYFVPNILLQQQQQQRHRPQETSSVSTVQFQWDALMAIVSVQTLVSRINARFQDNHSFLNKTILRLLRKVLEVYSLMDFFRGCCLVSRRGDGEIIRAVGTTEAALNSAWDSFLTRLFSVPTRISNALGSSNSFAPISTSSTPSLSRIDVEEWCQEVIFFKRLAAQLQECLDSLSSEDGNIAVGDKSTSKGQHSKLFGAVITKFLRLGYGKILVESMVSDLWDKDKKSMDTKCLGWRLALTHTASPSTASQFLTVLVEYFNRNQLNFDQKNPIAVAQQLPAIQRAANLLVGIGFGTVDDTKNTSNINNVMIEQVLFQGRVFGIGVLRMLICIQSGWPTPVRSHKDSTLAKTFKKALEIWSDSMLVSHASADYQKYVSYQVLLMIGYFSHEDIIEADLIPIFSNGISNWLDLESFKRKQIGLVVAEEFSRAVDTIGSPADFDLDNTDTEIQFARSLVTLKDGAKPFSPEVLSSLHGSSGVSESREERQVGSGSDIHSTQPEAKEESSDDEEDPDAIVDQFSRTAMRDDSDSDDDDDLKPYEMEYESDPDEDAGSSKKPKVAAPLYLRDLVSYLRAGEDRDKTEIGLQHAAELIRRKAGSLELEEFAENLANTLVQIQDNFDLTNFYKMRENALVALVVTSPVIASGVLTFQFYEKKNSLGQRLNILTALALGAREISGFDSSPSTSSNKPSGQSSRNSRNTTSSVYSTSSTAATTASSSTLTLVGTSNQRPPAATFDSIASNISQARTRRFSQKSNIEASRPTPKANAFSNLAPIFLGGLLGRWGGNRGAGMERGYDVLQKAPAMVLKKFVVTLGVLVHYAGNSIHLVPITRELFRFLLALRYHTPPSQPTPGKVSSGPSLMTESAFLTASLTSLKMPGDIGVSTSMSSSSTAGSSLSILPSKAMLPYDPDLLESILFDLLILVTPSSATLSDEILLHEFYAEVMECQQWAMELWEVYKLEGDGGDKARMYCAALLQRCFELMEIPV